MSTASASRAAWSKSGGPSLECREANAIWRAARVARARCKSSRGPTSAVARSASASSSEPAWYLACAAASARSARRRDRASAPRRVREMRRSRPGLHGSGRGLPSARARRRRPRRAPARHARDARPAGRDRSRRPLPRRARGAPGGGRRRRLRDRPQNERGVGELDAGAEPEQPSIDCGVGGGGVEPERLSGAMSRRGSPRGSAAAVSTSSWVSAGNSSRRRA